MYSYNKTLEIMNQAMVDACKTMHRDAEWYARPTGIRMDLWKKFDAELLSEIITDAKARFDAHEDTEYNSAMIDTAYAMFDIRDDAVLFEQALIEVEKSGRVIRNLDMKAVTNEAQAIMNRARAMTGTPKAAQNLADEIMSELVSFYWRYEETSTPSAGLAPLDDEFDQWNLTDEIREAIDLPIMCHHNTPFASC